MVILLVLRVTVRFLSKIAPILNKKVRFLFDTTIKLNKIGKVTIYLDDRRENSGEIPLDVPEILRFALDDKRECQKLRK